MKNNGNNGYFKRLCFYCYNILPSYWQWCKVRCHFEYVIFYAAHQSVKRYFNQVLFTNIGPYLIHGWAMGCLLWWFLGNCPHYNSTQLYVYCIVVSGCDPISPNWWGSHLSWIINTDRTRIRQKTSSSKPLQIAQIFDENVGVFATVGTVTSTYITAIFFGEHNYWFIP